MNASLFTRTLLSLCCDFAEKFSFWNVLSRSSRMVSPFLNPGGHLLLAETGFLRSWWQFRWVSCWSMRSELSLLTCPGHRAGRSLLAQEGARGCEITTWRAFSLLVMAAPWWFSPCRCQCIWSGSLTCIIITTGTRLKSQELECMCKALFYTSLFTWGLINEYLVPLIHN